MNTAKKMSPPRQIALLRRLRRVCPFAVLSGPYGYTCGELVNGVRSSSGMGARTKEARHCTLSCTRLRQQAFACGYDITISKHTINAYG